VAFAVPDFDPSVGGTSRQTRLQAEALQRRGYRVTVVSRRRDRSWRRREHVDGLDVVRLGAPGRSRLADARALPELLVWLARRRSDVAIVQAVMWPDAVVAAAAAGLLARTAHVWAIRGEATAALEGDGARRAMQARLRRFVFERAEHVVLTRSMEAELAAVRLARQSAVIPVPVDRGHFRPATQEERLDARRAFGLPDDAFVAVYVGHLERRKAVDRLVEAVERLANELPIHLLLVGDVRGVRDDTRAELTTQVAAAGLQQAVSFCGVVPDPRRHLWAADVLVLPSEREGMPNSLLEGLACGLPCVAPSSAGGDEVLDAATGIVPPTNAPEALATALRRLADDAGLRGRMGVAARERTREFDVERVADRYDQLYRRMLRRSGRS
jgi:glycosyltransferase involved in cell wall biosynthesis